MNCMSTDPASSLKIAIIADIPVWLLPGLESLSTPGHYATWLEALVPAFEEYQDLDLHWICMSKQTGRYMIHEAYGQTFHILPRWKKAFSMLTGYLLESRRINKIIDDIQPDLVHAWGTEDVHGLAASRCKATNRLFTLQGCLGDYLNLLGGNLLFRLQTMYEKRTIKKFKHGTAESASAVESLRRINPTMNIRQVDYGVHPDFFHVDWNPSDEPTITFIGAVTARKGIQDLITIANQPDLNHIRFQVLGDGDLMEELQSFSNTNIEWLGKCSRGEVIEALSHSWCLFIPTYADTGPTVIKEARVVGLPVITTTGAGASSYIERYRSGYVAEPGDIAGMCSYIRHLCSSRTQCIESGNQGHKEDRIQLSPAKTAQEFSDIYRTLTR